MRPASSHGGSSKKLPPPEEDDGVKLDKEFIKIMFEIEKRFEYFGKHEKIRIEQWSKKLCQITSNPVWKVNRNQHARFLLDMIMRGTLEPPFNKIPPEGPLGKLNKIELGGRSGRGSVDILNESNFEEIENYLASGLLSGTNSTRKERNFLDQVEDRPFQQHSQQYQHFSSEIQPKSSTNKAPTEKAASKPKAETNSAQVSSANKDFIKLKAELELSKLNEKALTEEIGIRKAHIEQLDRKLNEASNELKQSEETNQIYLGLIIRTLGFFQRNKDELGENTEIDDILNCMVKAVGEKYEEGVESRNPKKGMKTQKRTVDRSEQNNDFPVREEQEGAGLKGLLWNSTESPDFLKYLEDFHKKSEKLKKESCEALRPVASSSGSKKSSKF